MQGHEIAELLLQKDPDGMELLLKHYGPLIKYIIAPILSSPQDREDCLSEVTVRIWERIGQFDPQRGSWSAWLTAITRNTAISFARSISRHDAGEYIPDSRPSADPAPEEAVIRQEQSKALKAALGRLTAGELALFYRKYYYMQSTAQIAAELGMTGRSVEGKLYRLKRKLRRALGGEYLE